MNAYMRRSPLRHHLRTEILTVLTTSGLQFALSGICSAEEIDALGWKIVAENRSEIALIGQFAGNAASSFSCQSNRGDIGIKIDVPFAEEAPNPILTFVLMPSEVAITLHTEVMPLGNNAYSMTASIDWSDEMVGVLTSTDMVAFLDGGSGSGFAMEPKLTTEFLSRCKKLQSEKAL